MPWAPSLEAARHLAGRHNQLILLHFWSHNCVPCRRLEQAVFSDPVIAQQVGRSFVPVKINADRHPEIVQQYGVEVLPTDVVMTPAGQVVFRGVSPQNAKHFAGNLQLVAAQNVPDISPAPTGTSGGQPWWHQPGRSDYAATPPSPGTPPKMDPPTTEHRPPPTYDDRTVPGPDFGNQPNPHNDAQRGSRYSHDVNVTDNPHAQGPLTTPHYQPAATPPNNHNYAANVLNPSPPAVGPHTLGNSFSAPPQNSQRGPLRPVAQTPAPVQSPPQISPGNPPIGMKGYCPVTLVDLFKWQAGDTRWGAIHRGRTYLFAGPSEQQRFLAAADRYAPMLSGHDPVLYIDRGQFIGGKRQHGVLYRQQVFLFSSEETLNQFWKTPDRYATAIFQAMNQSQTAPPAR